MTEVQQSPGAPPNIERQMRRRERVILMLLEIRASSAIHSVQIGGWESCKSDSLTAVSGSAVANLSATNDPFGVGTVSGHICTGDCRSKIIADVRLSYSE